LATVPTTGAGVFAMDILVHPNAILAKQIVKIVMKRFLKGFWRLKTIHKWIKK
jgi:hypothetical protein